MQFAKTTTTPPPSPQPLQKAAVLFNQAIQATQVGKLTQAEKLYRQMLEADPKAAVGWVNLGLLLGRQKRFDEAIAALQKAVRLAPKEASFQGQLASLEWGAGRTDEAIVTAKSALALNPKNTDTLRTLAGAYLSQKRFTEAISVLKTWSTLQPKDPAILGSLATTQLDAQQPREALVTLRTMTQRFPKETNAFLMRGDLAGRLGAQKKDTKLLTEASNAYQKAFLLSPKNLRAGFNAAVSAEQAGDFPGALLLLEKLREKFPDAAMVRHSLALAYLQDIRRTPEDRVALGMKEAEAAVGRQPKNAEYVTTLGFMMLSQGNSREIGERAARVFQGALKLTPKNARTRRGLVEALLVQSAWGEAIPKLRELVNETPEDDALRQKLAATLQAAGKPAEAVLELRTIARRNPKQTKSLKDVATLLETLNQLDEAEKTLDEVLTRDPADTEALVRLGSLGTKTKKYDKAQAHFEAALTKKPENSQAFAGLIALFEAQEKKNDVLAVRERWVKADPKNNQARYDLGLLYADLGRDSDAVTVLRGLTLRQNDPSRNLYRQAIAEFYRRKGRFGEESGELRNLIAEEPNNDILRRRLAEALERAGRPAEAEQQYLGLIQRAPATDLTYRLALIGMHERIGKLDQAAQETEDLVTLRTGSDEARALLIRLRTTQKRTEAIAPFFEKIALSEPNHPNAYLVNALDAWFQSQKTPEKYLVFTQKVVETYPKSHQAWKRRAAALEKTKTLPEALAAWQKATEVDNNDSEAPLMLGKLLEELGKKTEAIAAYTLSVKRQRTDPALGALRRLGAPIPK